MNIIYDTHLNLVLQQCPNWLTIPMQSLSLFGYAESYLLIITAVYWCFDSKLGLRLALIAASGGWVNDFLKLSVHLPRPCWVDSKIQMLNLIPDLNFGFPSGHAQITLTFYGMIGYWMKSNKILIVIIILILASGISRLYLGVHFLLDVLGGWFFGFLMLAAFIILDNPISSRIAEISNIKIISGGLVLSIFLVLITAIVSIFNSNFIIPMEWIGIDHETISESSLFSLKNSLMTSGFLFGIITGGVIIRRLPYYTSGRWIVKGSRYILGLIGLLVIGIIFETLIFVCNNLMGNILTWLMSVCVGIWILYGAPWIFIKVGLNEQIT